MADLNVFDQLRNYYLAVAAVLRNQADAAAVFPNSTDVGMSRERVYFEFLRQHAPAKCNVFYGGFIFDEDGRQSDQMDIIVTTDTAPRYNLHNQDGAGKSFSPVEGTLGAFSIKSTLDKKELYGALKGIASIPPTRSLHGRKNIHLDIKHYDDWPLKVVYASKGVAPETVLKHLTEYYAEHPTIPLNRRPNFIHVAGSCFIARARDANLQRYDRATGVSISLQEGEFFLSVAEPDLQGITWTLDDLQIKTSASTQILFTYANLMRGVLGISRSST